MHRSDKPPLPSHKVSAFFGKIHYIKLIEIASVIPVIFIQMSVRVDKRIEVILHIFLAYSTVPLNMYLLLLIQQ